MHVLTLYLRKITEVKIRLTSGLLLMVKMLHKSSSTLNSNVRTITLYTSEVLILKTIDKSRFLCFILKLISTRLKDMRIKIINSLFRY